MQILRWEGEDPRWQTDELAREEPLEIRVRGRSISVTMRTPGDDADLASGFLLTEGIISGHQDLLRITHCDRDEGENILNVLLAPDVQVNFERLTRHVFASSSCGICGKSTIESVHLQFPQVKSTRVIAAGILSNLPQKMRAAQTGFDRTGGLHAAAIFDSSGRLIVLREDVGRHNAVDKVIGHCLRTERFPLDEHILLVSGRSSFEIMQKALAARVPIVAAVSAPSSLAVEFAAASQQTLVGFLRETRMNVYTRPDRITFTGGAAASIPVS